MLHNQNFLPVGGLTSEEVEFRKIKGLINKQDYSQKVSYFQIVIENTLTIFNLINFIIISGLFYYYFKFNDNRLLLDSIGILIVIFINTVISIFQKIKAVRALEKVELLKKHKVNVVREGKKYFIEIDEIVQDDILFITRGEQIPVDCEIVQCQKFEVDESLITGESLSIAKQSGNNLLSGSFCVNGFAYARAIRVGSESYSNQITHLAKKFKLTTSPLMNKINVIFTGSFIVTVVLIVLEGFRDISVGEIGIEEVRRISTIAFTIIPEGLIFFAAITFSIGIYRISKIGAIVQRINAIDSFSTINVICLDKTGTITKNEIRLSDLIPIGNELEPEAIEQCLGSFYLNSSNKNQTIEVLSHFLPSNKLHYLDEIPFDSELKFSAILFEDLSHKIREIYILGALEVLSEKVQNKYQEKLQETLNKVDIFGKRNLLFCKANFNDQKELTIDLVNKLPLQPISILALKDTVREDFIEVVDKLAKMGKEFKVLTGDSLDSTFTILKDAGLEVCADDIIDCRLIVGKPSKEIEELVKAHKYFARLTPSQKLNIVKILKSHHQKVCFIGDGINDLPAIKEADLGIAMDQGMTITKEVSDIVLQKNKFSLLPAIFNEGNKIINTIRYITTLYLVKNFAVLIMLLLNWFVSTPFCLTPRKSSLLSALAVGLPSYFISFRNSNTAKNTRFYRSIFYYVLSSGITILLFTYISYFVSLIVIQISVSAATNVMYSVFTIGTITSCFSLVAFEDKANQKYYGFYALLMTALFIFFSLLFLDFPPFNIISTFYEFDLLHIPEFVVTLIFSFLMSLVLIYFNKYKNLR